MSEWLDESSCPNLCPFESQPGFTNLHAFCKGPRVRLDLTEAIYDVKQRKIGEAALKVCGGNYQAYPGVPTISMVDWINTPLPINRLLEMYEQGRLPEQD